MWSVNDEAAGNPPAISGNPPRWFPAGSRILYILIFEKNKNSGILWEPSGIRRGGFPEVHCFRVESVYLSAIHNQGHLAVEYSTAQASPKSLVSILQCMQIL